MERRAWCLKYAERGRRYPGALETAGLCCASSPRVKLPRAARRQQRCEFTKAGVKAPPSPGAGNSLRLPHSSEKQQASGDSGGETG